MGLVFLSNYYTHHQQALCEKLDELTDHQFIFAATEEFSEERKQMGWSLQTNVPFVEMYNDWLTEGNVFRETDVIILGNAPLETVTEHLEKGGIVLKYSERVFKRGYQLWKWLPRVIRYWQRYGRYKSFYLLAASAYTPVDYAVHGTFLGKGYRWGYFPETKRYDMDVLMANKDPAAMVWCGRFLDWKHPEAAIAVAARLRCEGYSFRLEMIGAGEMEEHLKQMVYNGGLADCVQFLGTMASDDVRAHMEAAGIYMFTSDFREGWGAVLNESMNSGCAVVASHAIGSVPFLMEHGENGLIYKNGDIEDLYTKVKYLLDHPEEQRILGEHAYHTIADIWNAEIAAERLLKLIGEIRDHGSCDLYEDGPCSRAPILRNNWFKG